MSYPYPALHPRPRLRAAAMYTASTGLVASVCVFVWTWGHLT